MTVLPRSSVANFFIPSPASAWAHRGTATMASHPCLTDIRRTLYEDSAAINRLRGRARGARTRYHGPKALQIRQDRAADTDDHAGEEEPPSETRAPGPGHTRGRLSRPPEAADREGSDIGRRGPGNCDDRIEESEERDAEDDQAQDEQVHRRHFARKLEPEEDEDDGEDHDEDKTENIEVPRHASGVGVGETRGVVRHDRRLAPGPARIPFRGEGDPCEGADVLDTARRPADGPEGEGERQEDEEDREAEGKARRLDLEEHLELRAQARGGGHRSSATRQVDKKGTDESVGDYR